MIELPCANCSYDLHVELAHIKSVSTYTNEVTLGEINHPSNVIQLCRNCHWEFDHNKLDLAGVIANRILPD